MAAGEPAAGVLTGAVDAAGAGRVVFVFPGQGGQWAGMGRDLAASCPVFAARLAECGRALAPFTGWELEEVLAAGVLPDRADVIQPALWAVMVSLAAAWQAAGVTPDAVVGHSQGEIAAAVVAGILSLEDGARVVALRSKALLALSGRGGMVSVAGPADAVRDRIASWDGRLSVAAVNGPEATVVSGDPAALAELAASCEAAGIRARILPVDYASHGPQVESLRDDILAALAAVTPGPAVVPMVSAMTGEWLDGLEAEAGYWYDSLRSPVEFGRAVAVLAQSGHGTLVEVSPHPVLVPAITAPVVAGTLRRDDGGPARFLASLAEVHVQGVPVDWTAVLPAGRRVELPTYAFRRRRFWPERPLLGAAVELPASGGLVLPGSLSAGSHRWLGDHVVAGTVLVPGTALVEMAMQAARAAGCEAVEELTLEVPLVLPPAGSVRVQVAVDGADEDGRRPVEVYARAGGAWVRHASGWLAAAASPGEALTVWPPPGAEPVEVGDLYAGLAARGYEYGPAFRGLRAAWRRGGDIFAEVALPEGVEAAGFGVHPALLDAALHGAVLPDSGVPAGQVLLPFSWGGVTVHGPGASALRVRLSRAGDGSLALTAADDTGAPVVSAESVVLRSLPVGKLAAGHGAGAELSAVTWVPVPAPEPGGQPPDVVHAGAGTGGTAGTARAEVGRLLVIVQEWLAGNHPAGDRLAVVTRGAVPVAAGEGVTDLAGAAVWGLIRSAQSENPDRLVLVDLPPGGGDDVLAAALATGEPELAVRDGQLLARRLVRPADGLVRPADTVPWRLAATGTGTLDGLALVPYPEAADPLAAGQVRVAVRAAGLNFRDVLIGLDMYPGHAPMGAEVAGVVMATGP
ncbi:MAG TPA: acyltransferase domain-containing protein, partial [Streptosporangiaceae bacterium]